MVLASNIKKNEASFISFLYQTPCLDDKGVIYSALRPVAIFPYQPHAVRLGNMEIVWYFSAHSNPISAPVGSDNMGMVWCMVPCNP